MHDDDAELQRLRHAAFSREGTDEDRRRLAQLEARRPKAVLTPASVADEVDAVASLQSNDEQEVDDVDATPRVGSRRTLLLAVGSGVLVGALIGVLGTVALDPSVGEVANWSGESSLAVFDRDPEPRDDPSTSDTAIARLLAESASGRTADGGQLELRWIGAPGGFTTYAARWSVGESSRVCVVVTSTLETASSCVPESDFAADGIRIMAFGLDLRWGPKGAEVWANSSG